jgi:hypothetical protein
VSPFIARRKSATHRVCQTSLCESRGAQRPTYAFEAATVRYKCVIAGHDDETDGRNVTTVGFEREADGEIRRLQPPMGRLPKNYDDAATDGTAAGKLRQQPASEWEVAVANARLCVLNDALPRVLLRVALRILCLRPRTSSCQLRDSPCARRIASVDRERPPAARIVCQER